MPYIKSEDREIYDEEIRKIADTVVANQKNPGHLNYIISKTLSLVYSIDSKYKRTENYKNHNEVIGILECVKQEWYRKFTAPYEEYKEAENGSI